MAQRKHFLCVVCLHVVSCRRRWSESASRYVKDEKCWNGNGNVNKRIQFYVWLCAYTHTPTHTHRKYNVFCIVALMNALIAHNNIKSRWRCSGSSAYFSIHYNRRRFAFQLNYFRSMRWELLRNIKSPPMLDWENFSFFLFMSHRLFFFLSFFIFRFVVWNYCYSFWWQRQHHSCLSFWSLRLNSLFVFVLVLL